MHYLLYVHVDDFCMKIKKNHFHSNLNPLVDLGSLLLSYIPKNNNNNFNLYKCNQSWWGHESPIVQNNLTKVNLIHIALQFFFF